MHTLVDGKPSHESQLAQIWCKGHKSLCGTVGAQRAWQKKLLGDETWRRQESYRKMNVFSTDSAEKLQENSLVEQMWYFLTVAYLLGAGTRQI